MEDRRTGRSNLLLASNITAPTTPTESPLSPRRHKENHLAPRLRVVFLHALREHLVEGGDIPDMPSHKRFALDVLQTLRIKSDSGVTQEYGVAERPQTTAFTSRS